MNIFQKALDKVSGVTRVDNVSNPASALNQARRKGFTKATLQPKPLK